MFKVGDEVRVICKKAYYGWGRVKRGDVGEVVGVRGDNLLVVNFPDQYDWHGRPCEFELLKRQEERSLQPSAKDPLPKKSVGWWGNDVHGNASGLTELGNAHCCPFTLENN